MASKKIHVFGIAQPPSSRGSLVHPNVQLEIHPSQGILPFFQSYVFHVFMGWRWVEHRQQPEEAAASAADAAPRASPCCLELSAGPFSGGILGRAWGPVWVNQPKNVGQWEKMQDNARLGNMCFFWWTRLGKSGYPWTSKPWASPSRPLDSGISPANVPIRKRNSWPQNEIWRMWHKVHHKVCIQQTWCVSMVWIPDARCNWEFMGSTHCCVSSRGLCVA